MPQRNRLSNLKKNTISSLFYQVTALICGFILPRFILRYYGSNVNGLLSSITQFLAFFSLMEMGVGAVVRSALYKEIAAKDNDRISRILVSSKRFFNRIGLILIIYSLILMLYFPFGVDKSLGIMSTMLLVASMALSSIFQYLFGIVYQQLLNADQMGYIQYNISSVCLVLNTGLSIGLIVLGTPIVIVKIISSIVLLLRPIALRWYVNRNYEIDLKVHLSEEPLKNKWSGFSQHVATYITKNTDTIVLTIFSSLTNVSIYYVYNLVVNGIHLAFESMSVSFGPLLGDMYARKEFEKLNNTFSYFEFIIHALVSFVISCSAVLIIPFVQVYTNGIDDANYTQSLFALILVFATGFFCIRIPYRSMVYAAGHFRETQMSSIIEAVLNIALSVALVIRYGLVGVAIGTLIAMSFQTLYLSYYLKNHILNRPFNVFVRHFIADVIIICIVIFVGRMIKFTSLSYMSWSIMAIKIAFIAAAITAITNYFFFKKEFLFVISKIHR